MKSSVDEAIEGHLGQVELGESKLDVEIHELVIGAIHLPGGCHHVADHASEHGDDVMVVAIVQAEVDRLQKDPTILVQHVNKPT